MTGFPNYWIKDPVATQVVLAYHDWTTDTYGSITRVPADFSTGPDLCGPKSYKLYKSYPDRFSAVIYDPVREPWITLNPVGANYEIRVQTNDPIYVMNALQNFYLVVSLDDYVILNPVNVIKVQPIPINLHNC